MPTSERKNMNNQRKSRSAQSNNKSALKPQLIGKTLDRTKNESSKQVTVNTGNGKSKNIGKGQMRHRYPKRVNPFTEMYNTPDEGGVVALSKNPREVVLTLNATDAALLLEGLEGINISENLINYIKAKIIWTESYNAKIK